MSSAGKNAGNGQEGVVYSTGECSQVDVDEERLNLVVAAYLADQDRGVGEDGRMALTGESRRVVGEGEHQPATPSQRRSESDAADDESSLSRRLGMWGTREEQGDSGECS
jgi:hypothetical protein